MIIVDINFMEMIKGDLQGYKLDETIDDNVLRRI